MRDYAMNLFYQHSLDAAGAPSDLLSAASRDERAERASVKLKLPITLEGAQLKGLNPSLALRS